MTRSAGLVIALACAGCSHAAVASHPAPPAAPVSQLAPAVTARLDALLRRTFADQKLAAASIAIGRRDGSIVYAAGFGLRDEARHAPADRNTVYNVASITKQFTSAAVLLLAQEHRVSLADPVSKYLTGVSNAGSVTLRDLLAQTSGIPDYFYVPGYRTSMTAEDVAALALATPPRFRPGSRYEYSNTNFVLLGLVIEKVAGEPYAAFVTKHLLLPAHMVSSRIGDVPGSGADDAVAYAPRGGGFAPVAAAPNDLAFGAGALDATAPDLVRWAAALFGGRILDAAQTRRVLEPRLEVPGSTVRYNYGIRELGAGGSRLLYHRGRNAGYGGLLATFPQDGVTIALLASGEQLAPMYLAAEIHALVMQQHEPSPKYETDEIPSDSAIDARAARWLKDLAAGRVDRAGLTAEAALRYSSDSVAGIAAGLRAYGPLRSLALTEVDARYYGSTYTYRARFERAIAEYRFGLDGRGKVWNLAVDRED